MRSLMSVLITMCCPDDKINTNEMDGACSTYGDTKCIHDFGVEVSWKKTNWKI